MIYLPSDLLNKAENERRVRDLLERSSNDVAFEWERTDKKTIKDELEAMGEDKVLDAFQKGMFSR
jgi:hypothetical protein